MLNKNNTFMANCAGCKNPACYKGDYCSRGQNFCSYVDSSKNEYENALNTKLLIVLLSMFYHNGNLILFYSLICRPVYQRGSN